MAKEHEPQVLVIDDGDERAWATDLTSVGILGRSLHPSDVTLEDLVRADVVLVDYHLVHWPSRADVEFSLNPRDGLALSALLRRQVHDKPRNSPTAFAIRTGHLDELASPLPPESRQHILAQVNNLEWIFDKTSSRTVHQVKSLAFAMRKLPKQWPVGDACEGQLKALELLRVDSEELDAIDEVMRCRPPLHSMSSWSHGLAFVRWLLHRILPYPCFLIDDLHLAARLRVSASGLGEILNSAANPLAECQYTGILSDFAGRRWWRPLVERVIWGAVQEGSMDGARLREWLSTATGKSIEESTTDEYPTVCLDKDQRPLEYVSPLAECVRIQPDDWPAYAEQAWTTAELAKSERALGCLVKAEDLHRLEKNGT